MIRRKPPWEDMFREGGLYDVGPFTLEWICEMCPEQYEVFLDGRQCGYIRLRDGRLRCDAPECGGETVFAKEFGDNISAFEDDADREEYLSLICGKLAEREGIAYRHRDDVDNARLGVKAKTALIRRIAARFAEIPGSLIPFCGYGEDGGWNEDGLRICSYLSAASFRFAEDVDKAKIVRAEEASRMILKMGSRAFGLGVIAGRWICPEIAHSPERYFRKCLEAASGRKLFAWDPAGSSELADFISGWRLDKDFSRKPGNIAGFHIFSGCYSALTLDIETEGEELSFWWGVDFDNIIASGTIDEPWRMEDDAVISGMIRPALFAAFEQIGRQ